MLTNLNHPRPFDSVSTQTLRIGQPRIRKLAAMAAALIMIVGIMGSMQVANTPSAQAAPRGLYAKKCIIKAVVGPGVKGNGCNLYGAPYWTGGKLIHDPKVTKYLKACGEGIIVNAEFAVVGLFYGAGGIVSAVLLGCASGIVQAKQFGS